MSNVNKLLKEAAKELGVRSIRLAKNQELRRKETDDILNAHPSPRRTPKKRFKKKSVL